MKSIWHIPNPKNKISLSSASEALIGMGSSLGNREGYLRLGILHLIHHSKVHLLNVSQIWQTPPIGAAKNPFLNLCVRLKTSLSPEELLRVLFTIEMKCHRIRGVHWMDRTLDLDLLLYGKEIIDTPTLNLPHPRMLNRAFVMTPAVEIAGDMQHPIQRKLLSECEIPSNKGMWSVGRFVFVKS